MFNSVIVLVLCALVAGACEQSLSGTATPTGPSEATVQAATNSTSAGSAGTAVPQAATGRARPWNAKLTWTVTGIQWAGVPGQSLSTFDGRCSVPSDYVIGAAFTGEATHAGRVTGTTEHCSQIMWGPQGPMGAAYSDGQGAVLSANGSTITIRYGNGTTGVDAASGELWFHDMWEFIGGTGMFAGVTGSGDEGGRFMDFNALLAGAPVAMWMDGSFTYSPSGK